MNYIKQLNAFRAMLDKGCNLSPNARHLWFTLMLECNHNDWQEELEIHTGKLESLMGGRDKKLIERTRSELVEAGLLKVIHRHRKPALYTMVPLYIEGNISPQTTPQDAFEGTHEGNISPQTTPQPIQYNGNGKRKTPSVPSVSVNAHTRAKKKTKLSGELLYGVNEVWCAYAGKLPVQDDLNAVITCLNDFIDAGGQSEEEFHDLLSYAAEECSEHRGEIIAPYLITVFRNKLSERSKT